MPQSLALLIVHVVFSTKDRKPIRDPNILPALHAYLATIARDLGCECYRVGGIADHVHLAIRLSRTVAAAQLVERLKSSSSQWLKKQSPLLAHFAWQQGYSAFSVSPQGLNSLRKYIDSQQEHHCKNTFQQELLAFLEKYKMEFDERYLWD